MYPKQIYKRKKIKSEYYKLTYLYSSADLVEFNQRKNPPSPIRRLPTESVSKQYGLRRDNCRVGLSLIEH